MIVRQKNGKKSVTEMPAANMTHFRADQKYVEAFFPGGSLLLDESLVSMESQLVEQGFVRIHRNCFVRADLIRECEIITVNQYGEPTNNGGGWVTLEGVDEPVRASRPHAFAIRRLLKEKARA